MLKTIQLENYTIYIGNIWKTFNDFLEVRNYSSVFVLVDENTRQHCLPLLLDNSRLRNPKFIDISSGEKHKTIETCKHIWQQMMDQQAGRRSLMINLGGGVIGDMGGFCAGTFKRGIDFLQIPTTLLSQVDSSIGGKLGIDFGKVKNSIGLFQNPQAVLIFPDFLRTLPYRQIRSGFAEMIKHSLIADAGQWEKFKVIDNLNTVDWSTLLLDSLKVKKQIVEADPFEQNIRKALNFGHTIGHAIESFALETDTSLLHGEAIAAGMICESYLSAKLSGLSGSELGEIVSFVKKLYGKTGIQESNFNQLIELMKNDKKNKDNKINFTVLNKIGEAQIDITCVEELIKESLLYYKEL